MRETRWWLFSAALSTALLIIQVLLWVDMNTYQSATGQLVDEPAARQYIEDHWENNSATANPNAESTILLKTGIFIQSLQFFNSNEVNLTGYIWQRYEDGIHDDIRPAEGEVGFILPEQVNSGGDIDPREIYRIRAGGEELIGWYFEATLRQNFDYSTYPFDHKTVWVRMWAKDFSRNVILIPDFQSYNATGVSDTFGIEDEIVLGTWDREDTYFDYKLSNYDTNFGIPDYVGQDDFPELHYNFVIKRKFENAFIVYLLPLLLVATLLFATLLTVSSDSELTQRHDFNTTGFIAASSALFFVVMLAHIQLREQFAASAIVYIEYFYILMYAMLVTATANTYLFSVNAARWLKVIHYGDNIIPKVLYWPVLLTSLIIITVVIR